MADGTISLADGLGLKALDSNELRRRQQVFQELKYSLSDGISSLVEQVQSDSDEELLEVLEKVVSSVKGAQMVQVATSLEGGQLPQITCTDPAVMLESAWLAAVHSVGAAAVFISKSAFQILLFQLLLLFGSAAVRLDSAVQVAIKLAAAVMVALLLLLLLSQMDCVAAVFMPYYAAVSSSFQEGRPPPSSVKNIAKIGGLAAVALRCSVQQQLLLLLLSCSVVVGYCSIPTIVATSPLDCS
ncbi:hypothetical protein RHGRI_007826 [Rhododendron griersonianum]|uniref:Uncharacterized protein n=1 Tax=Rhododendron griersonianum TaxID=479676 RepID=A0AAV6KZ32_9ERIC|nr:hypothetical protein RHGRI_007826 [Rhododendron griersonianum]